MESAHFMLLLSILQRVKKISQNQVVQPSQFWENLLLDIVMRVCGLVGRLQIYVPCLLSPRKFCTQMEKSPLPKKDCNISLSGLMAFEPGGIIAATCGLVSTFYPNERPMKSPFV